MTYAATRCRVRQRKARRRRLSLGLLNPNERALDSGACFVAAIISALLNYNKSQVMYHSELKKRCLVLIKLKPQQFGCLLISRVAIYLRKCFSVRPSGSTKQVDGFVTAQHFLFHQLLLASKCLKRQTSENLELASQDEISVSQPCVLGHK